MSLAREARLLEAARTMPLQSEIERCQRMSAALDDMFNAATSRDGSYEAARDRFNAERSKGGAQ